MSEQSNVVRLPGQRRPRGMKEPEEQLAENVRKAYRKLFRAIDAAMQGGLKVELRLDTSDASGGRVKSHSVEITKRL